MIRHIAPLLSLFVAVAACGCSTPSYTANRADPSSARPPVTLRVDPEVRLISLDGRPVDELPQVGLRHMRKDKGINRREIVLSPGPHELVAGVGPFFSGSTFRGAAPPPPAMPVPAGGTGLSVGLGSSGGVRSTTVFRYPGSETDQSLALDLPPGEEYVLRVVGDDSPQGWRVEVVSKPAERKQKGQVVSRVTASQPAPYESEPFTRYFDLADGAALRP